MQMFGLNCFGERVRPKTAIFDLFFFSEKICKLIIYNKQYIREAIILTYKKTIVSYPSLLPKQPLNVYGLRHNYYNTAFSWIPDPSPLWCEQMTRSYFKSLKHAYSDIDSFINIIPTLHCNNHHYPSGWAEVVWQRTVNSSQYKRSLKWSWWAGWETMLPAFSFTRRRCMTFVKLQIYCQFFDICRLQYLISGCSKEKIKASSRRQAITKIMSHLHLTILYRYKLVQIHYSE